MNKQRKVPIRDMERACYMALARETGTTAECVAKTVYRKGNGDIYTGLEVDYLDVAAAAQRIERVTNTTFTMSPAELTSSWYDKGQKPLTVKRFAQCFS